MKYVVVYHRGSYRIHRATCSDVKKDRLAGADSWVATGEIEDIVSREIEELAKEGIEVPASDFRVLPCAKGTGR
ncbi:MAG: hypothetical protein GY769_17660 [bacterium]|nr:hypothetical protein [bacterium]